MPAPAEKSRPKNQITPEDNKLGRSGQSWIADVSFLGTALKAHLDHQFSEVGSYNGGHVSKTTVEVEVGQTEDGSYTAEVTVFMYNGSQDTPMMRYQRVAVITNEAPNSIIGNLQPAYPITEESNVVGNIVEQALTNPTAGLEHMYGGRQVFPQINDKHIEYVVINNPSQNRNGH